MYKHISGGYTIISHQGTYPLMLLPKINLILILPLKGPGLTV